MMMMIGPVMCGDAESDADSFVLIVRLVSVDSAHFLLRLEWAETARIPATASPREQTSLFHRSAKNGTQTHTASCKSVWREFSN